MRFHARLLLSFLAQPPFGGYLSVIVLSSLFIFFLAVYGLLAHEVCIALTPHALLGLLFDTALILSAFFFFLLVLDCNMFFFALFTCAKAGRMGALVGTGMLSRRLT